MKQFKYLFLISSLFITNLTGQSIDQQINVIILAELKDPLETKYYHGLGLVGGVGYEVLQFDKCTINLKVKITYRNLEVQEGRTRGISFSLLTGVNF